jgi:hypothetical protein
MYTSHFHIINLMSYTVSTFMITMFDIQLPDDMELQYILGCSEQNDRMTNFGDLCDLLGTSDLTQNHSMERCV